MRHTSRACTRRRRWSHERRARCYRSSEAAGREGAAQPPPPRVARRFDDRILVFLRRNDEAGLDCSTRGMLTPAVRGDVTRRCCEMFTAEIPREGGGEGVKSWRVSV